ncbi:hypothetical protein G7007_08445 [Pseudomonas entomophila]|jgi:hypothetical protein|uniref:hypothetical protein n=1 Tax=Pseudomonas entomophila TaxID=312306 RepID=UPI0015E35CAF|nr:hypothetical protein [Pseudomonas entomophila]MBA1192889.1 hypothetical protein [Pseudomonas entomophila]
MSLAMILFSLISAWMAVALAMVWGVLRIARRHQGTTAMAPAERERRPANRATPALSLH